MKQKIISVDIKKFKEITDRFVYLIKRLRASKPSPPKNIRGKRKIFVFQSTYIPPDRGGVSRRNNPWKRYKLVAGIDVYGGSTYACSCKTEFRDITNRGKWRVGFVAKYP